ncbi:MAG: LysR family transcriptional regulator [Pseudomonadota bacterium]
MFAHWEAFHTAFVVSRAGTVSAAADELGVHRASVIRHINSLEEALGVVLFRRNARGYSLTEAGEDLLRTGARINGLFDRLKQQAVLAPALSGTLKIASPGIWAAPIARAVARFRGRFPSVTIELDSSDEHTDLAAYPADVVLRRGAKAEPLDYVVLPFTVLRIGLFAHRSYIQRFGLPGTLEDLASHHFVRARRDGDDRPQLEWLQKQVPKAAYSLTCQTDAELVHALRQGAGLGFYPADFVVDDDNFVEVPTGSEQWFETIWLLTHGDVHRSAKVQYLLDCFREDGWLQPEAPASFG